MRTAQQYEIQAIPLALLHGRQYADRITDSEAVSRIAENYDPRLMEPIKVRRDGAGGYEVVEGRHRLEAFKLMQEDTIPAQVLDLSDDEAKLIAIAGNNARNADTPRTKGIAWLELQRHGYSPIEAARAIGATAATAEKYAAISKVDARVAQLHEEKKLGGLGIIYAISQVKGLSGAGQFALARRYMQEVAKGKPLTTGQFTEFCFAVGKELLSRRNLKAQHSGQAMLCSDDEDLAEVQAIRAASDATAALVKPKTTFKAHERAALTDADIEAWARRNPAKFLAIVRRVYRDE